MATGHAQFGIAASVAYVPGICTHSEFGSRDCFSYTTPSDSVDFDERVLGTIPFEVVGRIGVVERIDMGAKVSLFGVRLDTKFQLVDTARFDLALGVGGRIDITEFAGFVLHALQLPPGASNPDFSHLSMGIGVLHRFEL